MRIFLLTPLLASFTIAMQNFIIYMTDDQGYGEMPGNSLITMPNIKKFMDEGRSLNNFYTAPLCGPSRWQSLTGSNEIRFNGFDGTIAPPTVTLPRAMQQLGYHTMIVGKYGFGGNKTISSASIMGFTESYIYPTHIDAHYTFPSFLESNGAIITFANNKKADQTKCLIPNKCSYGPDLFNSVALQYITEKAAEKIPFFLVWTPNLPHVGKFQGDKHMGSPVTKFTPYNNRPWTKSQRGHASMITNYMDRDIGQLTALLRQLNIDTNTYIVFYSDNGAPQGLNLDVIFKSNKNLRGGKSYMYEGGTKVPAIIWGPGRIPSNTVSNYPFSSQDLLPTITELAGKKIIKNTAYKSAAQVWLEGDQAAAKSLDPISLELCPGNVDNKCLYAFYNLKNWQDSLLKLLNNGNDDELYELRSDPIERNNLANNNNYSAIMTEMQIERKNKRIALG